MNNTAGKGALESNSDRNGAVTCTTQKLIWLSKQQTKGGNY